MNRRSFIKGALALALTPRIPFIGDSPVVDPMVYRQVDLATVDAILKEVYMPAIIDQIFRTNTILEIYNRSTLGGS